MPFASLEQVGWCILKLVLKGENILISEKGINGVEEK